MRGDGLRDGLVAVGAGQVLSLPRLVGENIPISGQLSLSGGRMSPARGDHLQHRFRLIPMSSSAEAAGIGGENGSIARLVS